MLNIDEISDYRDLLKNYYTQRKLDMPLYSYKMMGQKLGLDTSQVFRVLNKEVRSGTVNTQLLLLASCGPTLPLYAGGSRSRVTVTLPTELQPLP